MSKALLDRFTAYILSQAAEPAPQPAPPRFAVTISREAGAGAITVAQQLGDYLQANQADPGHPWAIFDRNLAEKILDEHRLPKRLERFLAEDATHRLRDAVEELVGLHPASWTLVQHTSETIAKLAERGNVILVGRGAHLVTARFKHVIHIRLVAPREQRIRHVARYFHLTTERAEKYVKETDRARKNYILQNFASQIDDDLAYHFVINTGRVGFEEAARFIGDAVLHAIASSYAHDLASAAPSAWVI